MGQGVPDQPGDPASQRAAPSRLQFVEISAKAAYDRKALTIMDRVPGGPSPRHEPMFNAPAVVVSLAIVFIAIYAGFDWTRPHVQDLVLDDLAFVPGRLTVWLWPAEAIKLLVRAKTDPAALEQVQAMRDLHVFSGGPKLWTLLTYAFLHGSWTHVLLNTIWLVAFGPPVARRFGTARFLAFMAVTAIISALAQWMSSPMEFAPLIGASGSDSGLMGAVARFMFQPGAPLSASGFMGREAGETVPAASLGGILADRRARIFLVVWFVTNFVFGAFARSFGLSDMPVAWVAHIGGFIAGIVLFPLFDRPPRSPAAPPY
jgi:membrane associated rhomboid family serine protease